MGIRMWYKTETKALVLFLSEPKKTTQEFENLFDSYLRLHFQKIIVTWLNYYRHNLNLLRDTVSIKINYHSINPISQNFIITVTFKKAEKLSFLIYTLYFIL